MDLTYLQLRKLLQEYVKYPGTKNRKKISVVNEGYPGNFNYSITEGTWMEEFGSYIDLKDLIYTTIQPVIRYNDFVTHILQRSNKTNLYLSLFEIGDICGWINKIQKNSKEHIQITKFVIGQTYKFLVNELGLDSNKIKVKCFGGGDIEEVTQGKYKIRKLIKSDNVAIEKWRECGIKEENIILDKTRDTLLALWLHRPTPWGYRMEIFYECSLNGQENLIDIGTIEHIIWKPVIKDEKVINIVPWENCFVAGGVGLERILLIKNNFNHIVKCDHIYPLYETILTDIKDKNEHRAFIITESLRTIHRIITDCKSFSNLSKERKKKLKLYFRTLEGLEDEQIKGYLKENSQLQSCYPELKDSVNLVTSEIIEFFKRKGIY